MLPHESLSIFTATTTRISTSSAHCGPNMIKRLRCLHLHLSRPAPASIITVAPVRSTTQAKVKPTRRKGYQKKSPHYCDTCFLAARHSSCPIRNHKTTNSVDEEHQIAMRTRHDSSCCLHSGEEARAKKSCHHHEELSSCKYPVTAISVCHIKYAHHTR